MREIKFRAWQKSTRKMISAERFREISVLAMDPALPEREHFLCLPLLPDFELMQFIGLLDKHGKEIYEGDIVYNEECFGCVSSWGDAEDEHPTMRLVRWNKQYAKFDWSYISPEIQDRGCSGYTLCAVGADRFEVIGNIHQNPELLKANT